MAEGEWWREGEESVGEDCYRGFHEVGITVLLYWWVVSFFADIPGEDEYDWCFAAGEKEIRCWTIPRGCLAPQAAGAIHGDFERGFIKAEVVAYQDFHDLCEGGKSMGPIKAAGKYRQEGRGYEVKDGEL